MLLLTFKNLRVGFLTVAVAVLLAPVALAQSIVDARRVEFTPSVDHDTLDDDGSEILESYWLDIFVSGSTLPARTVNLGKPDLDGDGMIRVDFVSLLATPLTEGVVYETRVSAVGPGGAAPSLLSNTFGFTAACAPTISTASQSFASAGGSVTVSAGAGNAAVTFAVASTTATTQRTGTLTVAGQTFTVTQTGVGCSFSISPSTQAFAAAGGSGTVAVTTTGGLRVDGDQRRRMGDGGQRIERNRKRHGEVQRRGKYQRVHAFGDADDCG